MTAYIEECKQEDVQPELFPFVWPLILNVLEEPRSEREVREYFSDLRLGQARDWLGIATERGYKERSENPVRYVVQAQDEAGDDEETESNDRVDRQEERGMSEPQRELDNQADLFPEED